MRTWYVHSSSIHLWFFLILSELYSEIKESEFPISNTECPISIYLDVLYSNETETFIFPSSLDIPYVLVSKLGILCENGLFELLCPPSLTLPPIKREGNCLLQNEISSPLA